MSLCYIFVLYETRTTETGVAGIMIIFVQIANFLLFFILQLTSD